jgi:small-conductance mechanosensitive channel
MKDTPLDELLQALSEGLARPHHFWTLIVIALALAGGWLVARIVRRRAQARLAAATGAGGGPAVAVDALRFSIEGVRRLAFPLAAQALLWGGALVLRASGVVKSGTDARLLQLAMTLLAAMAIVRLVVYVLRRVFRNVAWIAAFERALALAIWAVVALHVTGWLADVVAWMEATKLPLGLTRVSLWTIGVGALSVLVTLLAALWLGSALEARLLRAPTLDLNLRVVFARILRAVLVAVAVLLSLSMVGIDLTVLSVFGGALGVGLGLGLQRIASSYVSGFIILLDRSLRIGDMITVDKYYGAVTQIKTRYTVIRALDGTEAILPNELLVSTPVTNHSYSDRKVRLAVKVSVAYGTDLDVAMRLMTEAARQPERVLADPAPSAALLGFGADGLDLEVGFWIGDPEEGRLNVQSTVALAIYQKFRAAGIEIPFAQRDVSIKSLPAGWPPVATAAAADAVPGRTGP